MGSGKIFECPECGNRVELYEGIGMMWSHFDTSMFYPAKKGKENWQWRVPFKTSTVDIGGDISKENIFAKLDECLTEVQAFEVDLKQKLNM
jgi:hypothetical protein